MTSRPTRFAVAARAAAALFGGYLIASMAAIAVALSLPLSRADAVLFGTIGSFALYIAVIIVLYARVRPGFRQSMSWLHT
ncbi:MAG: hypothetical protein AB7E60_08000 [Sphingobium sp.]